MTQCVGDHADKKAYVEGEHEIAVLLWPKSAQPELRDYSGGRVVKIQEGLVCQDCRLKLGESTLTPEQLKTAAGNDDTLDYDYYQWIFLAPPP